MSSSSSENIVIGEDSGTADSSPATTGGESSTAPGFDRQQTEGGEQVRQLRPDTVEIEENERVKDVSLESQSNSEAVGQKQLQTEGEDDGHAQDQPAKFSGTDTLDMRQDEAVGRPLAKGDESANRSRDQDGTTNTQHPEKGEGGSEEIVEQTQAADDTDPERDEETREAGAASRGCQDGLVGDWIMEEPRQSTIRYLEKHHIVSVLQTIIGKMAYKQPDDPATFMKDQLEDMRQNGKLPKPEEEQAAPTITEKESLDKKEE